MKRYLINWKHCFLIFVISITIVNADELIINGDTNILTGTNSTFQLLLQQSVPYPSLFFFGYECEINLPKPVNDEVISKTTATYSLNFANVPPDSYTFNVKVYVYFLHQKAWKVAEKSITLQIKDKLDDFYILKGKQDNLPPFTSKNAYKTNDTINFEADQQCDNSVLSNNSTNLSYQWQLTGPNSTNVKGNERHLNYNFTIPGDYNLQLDLIANITQYSIVRKGLFKQTVHVKEPVADVKIDGNNYVKDGSLLHLNVSCNGSSRFMICHYFSDTKTNKTCFNSSIIVENCFLSISHYFRENGTHYMNIGVRNDVSEMMQSAKVLVYKVGPKQSLVFVILPLVSSFLVIIIVLLGIAHHIKQRRLLNATIEVATMENFGLYGTNTSLNEKSFIERIHDSLRDLIRSN
ncbi:hypothetical protein RDWZM_004554 [Blomia tropicalis]|uniref:PKD domain-containing protein n=1 Tax=Blomia tropicalis TaxID=40697 RepID=A0A9Q0M657_BLOTA|nr:hypothetical protein RDWZM_004554 [Blomia tropicalis]